MEQFSSSVVTPNISSTPGLLPPASSPPGGLTPAAVLSLCFLLGVPGNIAVIILKPNREHLSSLSLNLMLNLAVSDLLSLLTLPLWIYGLLYEWTFSLVLCKLLSYLVYCCLYGSLLTVTMLSVQRYLQVVHLREYFHQIGQRRLLAFLWLVAMILSIPALVVWQLTTEQHWTKCQEHYAYPAQLVVVRLTEYLVGSTSVCVVVFSYICLHRKVNQAAFFNHPRTTRLVTSIIVTSFVLWMPYLIMNVLYMSAAFRKNEGLLKFCRDNRDIVASLVFVNSCVNPLLYAFASKNMYSLCQKKTLNVSDTADHELH